MLSNVRTAGKSLRRTPEVSDGNEPPMTSEKHNKRERLIPVRSTDFVERSRYAAERRDRLAKLGRLLYPISHASAQLFPRFSLAQEAEIEYNPHFLGGV